MEEPLKIAEGQVIAPVEQKERYLGSVRFFRHMILSTIAALIIIPVILSVIFFCKYKYLQRKYIHLETEYTDYICQAEAQQEEQTVIMQETQAELAYFKDEEMAVQILEEGALEIPFHVDAEQWNYLLINENHPLPQDFEPMLADTRNGKKVDWRIKRNLEKMLDAAQENGFNLIICSAYRDYEKQNELIDESIAEGIHKGMSYENAFFEMKKQLGRVGCSEHHTGLAVDLVEKSYQSLDAGHANTKEAQWLETHACEYGFILRYPKDKEEITGMDFESWHFRYVGTEAAMYMKEHNLCLEEFLELAAAQ